MATDKQKLGEYGEKLIAKHMTCPRCKRFPTLRRLPNNFKCADIICDVCGYLVQVKTARARNIEKPPKRLIAAAWGPQKERIDAGIYFPLFLILVSPQMTIQIYYLPVEFQHKGIFVPRKPLGNSARRSGWQGFYYDFTQLSEGALIKTSQKASRSKKLTPPLAKLFGREKKL